MLVKIKTVRLFYFTLLGIDFFSLNLLPGKVWVALETFVLFSIVIALLPRTIITNQITRKRKIQIDEPVVKKNFTKLLWFYLLSTLPSIYFAYSYHGQSVIESYGSYRIFGFVFLYFYLHRKDYKIADIENIILFFGFIFQIIYWVQDRTSITIFGRAWYEEHTDITRNLFNGRHFFMLSFFIILTRFKYTYKYILLFFFYLATVFIMQMRVLLAPALLLTLYHFRHHLLKSFIPAIGVISLFTVILLTNDTIVEKLINKSTNEVKSNQIGADRAESAAYYLFANNRNIYTRIFGEGLYTQGTKYGDQQTEFRATSKLSPTDVGLIGWTSFMGWIWALAVILLIIKSFRVKTPSKYIYTKYYMVSLLFSLFVGEWQYIGTPSIISLMYIYYILDKGNFLLQQGKQEENSDARLTKPRAKRGLVRQQLLPQSV